VLQQALDIAAKTLGLDFLVALPTHILDLDNWDFLGTSFDSIGTGLLPFCIVPPDAPSKQAKKVQAELQEWVRQCDMSDEAISGAISSANAKKLYNAKGYLPSDWSEADTQLELHTVLLGAILGVGHSLVAAHCKAFAHNKRIRTRLQAAINKKVGPKLGPALMVLHFQLHH